MDDGFITVAAIAPKIRIGDVAYNVGQIKQAIDQALAQKVTLLVLPELCVTAATCQDLFYQDRLISAAAQGVAEIAHYTKDKKIIVVVGAPLRGAMSYAGNVYNCSVVINSGVIEKVIAKQSLSAQLARWFQSDVSDGIQVVIGKDQKGYDVGCGCVLCCQENLDFTFAVHLGSPSIQAMSPAEISMLTQANIICNPDASWISGKSAGELADDIRSLTKTLGDRKSVV